ncbi:MAG: carbonic anhydrase [Bdellovibrionota bacterium]
MRLWIPCLLGCATFVWLGCSSSHTNDYYRDRALITSLDQAATQPIEKRELVATPYRRLAAASEVNEKPPATGSEALDALREGNRRYVENLAAHPQQTDERRKQLVSAQHPHTAVLSCSDSRVPPELIFDQGLGSLFIVRNAGDVADDVATASLEYAVEHLGVKMILVMGHQSCGAVKTTLETPKGTSAGSKDLDTLLSIIRPNLKGIDSTTAGPGLSTAVRSNVSGVSARLMKSKIIREAVEKHGLLIARGIYSLDTGKVEFWF